MPWFILIAMKERILHIAAYDITSEKRLRAALKVARNYATGGQKSVFECFLTEGERRSLLAEMLRVVEPAEDRFFLLRLDPRTKVTTLGIAVAPVDRSFFYVG